MHGIERTPNNMTIDIQLTPLHHRAPHPTDEDHGEPSPSALHTQGTTRPASASTQLSLAGSGTTHEQNQALSVE
jgi:hypothetical protein